MEIEPVYNNPGGTFTVKVGDKFVWDRKVDGGFPEIKELKMRVRDVISPEMSLGHTEKSNIPGKMYSTPDEQFPNVIEYVESGSEQEVKSFGVISSAVETDDLDEALVKRIKRNRGNRSGLGEKGLGADVGGTCSTEPKSE